MKLLNIVVLALALVVGTANAQFNRVGNSPSLNMSWVTLDTANSHDWQGVQITNTIPIGDSVKVFDQPVRFNVDVNAGFVKNNDLNANFGSYSIGGTVWINNGFEKETFAIAPYFRGGIAANSGNFVSQNNSYWSYQVEPGLVFKVDHFYGLLAYNYGEGFNASNGSVVNAAVFGVGVNLSKNFAIEGRYDLGYGSYDVNKLALGVTYKFW